KRSPAGILSQNFHTRRSCRIEWFSSRQRLRFTNMDLTTTLYRV
ncbi:unnamed protein product, partial [Allacma fusca]